MAAVDHYEFAKFSSLVPWPFLEAKSASVHQISSKSCDPRLRYSDKIIVKMVSVRRLEFLKFAILVMWPVFERDSASSY